MMVLTNSEYKKIYMQKLSIKTFRWIFYTVICVKWKLQDYLVPVFDGGYDLSFIFLDPDRLRTTANRRFYRTILRVKTVVPNHFKTVTVLKRIETYPRNVSFGVVRRRNLSAESKNHTFAFALVNLNELSNAIFRMVALTTISCSLIGCIFQSTIATTLAPAPPFCPVT